MARGDRIEFTADLAEPAKLEMGPLIPLPVAWDMPTEVPECGHGYHVVPMGALVCQCGAMDARPRPAPEEEVEIARWKDDGGRA